MTIQPLIIYKTNCGKPVQTRRFKSTAEAVRWLRSEGCRLSNGLLGNLGDDSIELLTEDFEYEIQADLRKNGRRRHVVRTK